MDTVVIDKDKDNLDMEVEMGMVTSNQDLVQMQEALINVEKEIKIEKHHWKSRKYKMNLLMPLVSMLLRLLNLWMR